MLTIKDLYKEENQSLLIGEIVRLMTDDPELSFGFAETLAVSNLIQQAKQQEKKRREDLDEWFERNKETLKAISVLLKEIK